MKTSKSSKLLFDQPGVIVMHLDDNDLIKKSSYELLEDKTRVAVNNTLAGHLQHEYKATERMEKYFLNNIKNCMNNYLPIPSEIYDVEDDEYVWNMDTCWVNFQKKNEFNPIHHHTGCFSFVYWVNIPFDVNEELKHPSVKQVEEAVPGAFTFIYSDILGNQRVKSIITTKKDEGTLMVFPARMKHGVYPFYTSDEYRISISGNLSIKMKSNNSVPLQMYGSLI
jgi:hypothetical protein